MKARHKKAAGGPMTGKDVKEPAPTDIRAGKDSNVVKEAKEKKRGGKVEGERSKMRLDRPGRKRGGRVGCESSPLSSAARVGNRPGGKMDRDDD